MAGTADVHVVRAEHVGPEFDGRIASGRLAVSRAAIHHLAQYSFGTFDFSIDVLDQVDDPVVLGAQSGPGRCRDEVGYLGRQLHYMMRALGESLAKCDSGRIIRAVFDFGTGSLFFYEIRPGEYLVGLTLTASVVPAADAALATATTAIRGALGLPDQSPGGFSPAPGEPNGPAPVEPGRIAVARAPAASGADDVFLRLSVGEVAGRALDYVARFDSGTWASSADVFDDASVAGFFTTISRRRRRAVYQEIGAQFQTLGGSIDRALHGVVGRRVRRTVTDVEQGALYFERRDAGELLVGVTLAQARVRVSLERFGDLVRRYSEAVGEKYS